MNGHGQVSKDYTWWEGRELGGILKEKGQVRGNRIWKVVGGNG